MELSVVIPVYNSEQSIQPLVDRLRPVLEQVADRYELILVNDGSKDDSWRAVSNQAAEHGWIRGINLMRNYGQHNALLCGIRDARFELIVTIDDDLQHPPEEIPNLLAKLGDDYDVVYGTPQAEQHGFFRDVASVLTKLALKSAMGVDTARGVSAFRAFRTPLRNAFADYSGSFISIDVLLTWATTRFTAIPVRHDPRTIGASNYTFGILVKHALNMMTGFSTLPLQVSSLIGFLLTLFGVFLFFYVVGRFLLQGEAPAGFPFLASIITIFSGGQLLALGIIGEYLARMHFRLMERPPYVIGERITTDRRRNSDGVEEGNDE